MKVSASKEEGIDIITLENEHLSVRVAPSVGGKITSIFSKNADKEFIWTNKNLTLQSYPVGTEYDPHFYGGVDELFPSDIPETVNGIAYPDHGELWTLGLNYQIEKDIVQLHQTMPLSELYYSKTISLDETLPIIHTDYTIRNDSNAIRYFLWKMHAALLIEEGDYVECFATKGQVVDPEYSRFKSPEPFDWPTIENTNAAIVPAKNNTLDFFYIYGLDKGEMSLISANKKTRFTYYFDTKIFPYLWYFASYGGFLNHYTAILEPCTSMPISLNDAIALNQCSALQPGEIIQTRVSIYAGEK